ncbi:MAG: methyltransferase domain-containing protein [Candidatus Saccharimonadales bacterium]
MHNDHKAIVEYYDTADVDYRLLWHLNSHMAMHFGFWDEGITRLRDALGRENEVLAAMAQVKSGTTVLDAGCGVGGSAIYLAAQHGAAVEGITLSQKQVDEAVLNARRCGVEKSTMFSRQDFTKTNFDSETFDVVWAIESVCHAENKADFIQEAFRVLKPSGRLIIADYFLTRDDRSPEENEILRRWVHGWKMNELVTRDAFRHYLHDQSFEDIIYEDASRRVMPSLRRLARMSVPARIITYVAQKLRVRSATQTGNVVAAHSQYQAMRRGLWQYGIYLARKSL